VRKILHNVPYIKSISQSIVYLFQAKRLISTQVEEKKEQIKQHSEYTPCLNKKRHLVLPSNFASNKDILTIFITKIATTTLNMICSGTHTQRVRF